KMAESIMERNPNFYGSWDYVTGTVLRGFIELWKISGEDKYFEYIQNSVDQVINSQGQISDYDLSAYNIDEIKEGSIVLFLYRITGYEKYKKAAELLKSQLNDHPRTSEGGFWHKLRYPHQMWLDGLYMGSPFLAEYGELFNESTDFDDVINQIILVHKYTRDSIKGLYYHGWDESKEQDWADPITGQSPSFWGRAMGWYAMAIVDVMDFLPLNHPGRDSVISIMQMFSEAIAEFQDSSSGLWWQVVDEGGREGNYLESSVSVMFTYAIAKAIRKGYIDTSYMQVARKAHQGIITNFITENNDETINLIQNCLTAGLGNGRDGTYEYYVYETNININDGKGLGPFILASLEIENTIYPPNDLTLDSLSGKEINLVWKDNSYNESGFIMERTGKDNEIINILLDKDITCYSDTNFEPLSEYYYNIRAYNEVDTSKKSIELKVNTLGLNGAPTLATEPNPFEGQKDISILIELSWTPGQKATSHDVYFGKTNPPSYIGNYLDNTYMPSESLEYNTTYYWRIDEVNENGTTEGEVWSFTTESAPLTDHTIDFNSSVDLNIFPNPAKNQITVSNCFAENKYFSINFIDISGKQIIEQKVIGEGITENVEIEVKDLITGMYYIIIENSMGMQSCRKLFVIK
ncbi:MAG: glycoside hydrolase family 88 protein, partial [Bacteroidales bacterium]|nr:glycoside hydrolase family 88 protein [Bacteroidales bacterium]